MNLHDLTEIREDDETRKIISSIVNRCVSRRRERRRLTPLFTVDS